MKTKKLIKLLQDIDPSGEIECCIANRDIYFVEKLPSYYDGTLQILERDETKTCYNIIGAKYVRDPSISKIMINPLSIEDAISEDVSLTIDYSALNSIDIIENYRRSDNKTRQEFIDINREEELKFFRAGEG